MFDDNLKEGRMDIKGLYLDELKQYVSLLGEKPFRAKQLYEWMHKKLATNYDEMTDLSKRFRDRLNNETVLEPFVLLEKRESNINEACKYLFQLHDGNIIESVLMRYRHGLAVCVSAQVGCKMGCIFCASTIGGLVRNLEASEMLSQVYEIQRDKGERISNVIVMGIGEPLENYDALLRFIRLLSNEDGLNVSLRNITVSTCGILGKIERLANEKLPITLAVSLHAPNDEVRRRIMPIANLYTIDELLCACRGYVEITGRRITFEYTLIKGINDSAECANELGRRLQGLKCHVNLIPFNETTNGKCRRSDKKDMEYFKKILEKNRINVTIRRGMGEDVMAACGQLRRNQTLDKRKEWNPL